MQTGAVLLSQSNSLYVIIKPRIHAFVRIIGGNILNQKYRLIVLAVVVIAVVAVLLISSQTLFSPAGEKQIENEGSVKVEETAGAEFEPTGDPYAAYVEARRDGKPIVLEFYARW